MLAHAHGQPATPTTMGEEPPAGVAPAAPAAPGRGRRRPRQRTAPPAPSGATSPPCPRRLAARQPCVRRAPPADVEPVTTRSRPRLAVRALCDVGRFNRVLHNMLRRLDVHLDGLLRQVRGHGAIGSSTMPHKVNPIRFENAEANLEVSDALFDVLAATLVQSRLQRDLTVRRCSATSGRDSATACSDQQRPPGPRRPRRRPRGDRSRPRRQLEDARRAGPVDDAALAARAWPDEALRRLKVRPAAAGSGRPSRRLRPRPRAASHVRARLAP